MTIMKFRFGGHDDWCPHDRNVVRRSHSRSGIGPEVSDRRACFGSRSILVDLTEESSDGGDNRACTCSVDQIETVTDTWQLDIAHGRR